MSTVRLISSISFATGVPVRALWLPARFPAWGYSLSSQTPGALSRTSPVLRFPRASRTHARLSRAHREQGAPGAFLSRSHLTFDILHALQQRLTGRDGACKPSMAGLLDVSIDERCFDKQS